MCVCAQSCPTLCNPINCSSPSSSVYGIFQARIMDWVAISFSRDFPDPGIEPTSPALQVDSLSLRHHESLSVTAESFWFFFPSPTFCHFSTKEGWEPGKHHHQRLSLLWLADLHTVSAEGSFQKGLHFYKVIFHWSGYSLSLGHFKIIQKEETNNILPFCFSPAYCKSKLILSACE